MNPIEILVFLIYKMAQYNRLNTKLPNSQLNKLKAAIKNISNKIIS